MCCGQICKSTISCAFLLTFRYPDVRIFMSAFHMEGYTMIQVIKADGAVSDFTLTKISDAIMRAFMAVDIRDCDDTADLLALRVTADFQERVSNGGILAEDIRCSVGRVLTQAGYADAARVYQEGV